MKRNVGTCEGVSTLHDAVVTTRGRARAERGAGRLLVLLGALALVGVSGCHPGVIGQACACDPAGVCPLGCGVDAGADGLRTPDGAEAGAPDDTDGSVPGDAGGTPDASGPPPEPVFALDCAAHPGLVHPIFTDHMVLQRDAWDPVWGCTTPGGAVSVAVAGQSVSATADATGFWKLRLAPMPAGGPYSMVITGAETRTLTDVLVGDVWLCSGQSNMQMAVQGVLNAAQEIADAANYPSIRLFTVPPFKGSPRPDQVFQSATAWQQTTPSSVPSFSATCYFFARGVYQRTTVPQGLINSSYGGTMVEWWMSAPSLATDPDFADDIVAIAGGQYPAGDFYPTSLFNGMIAPLLPFALRGMVWYQGESNADRPVQYRRLLAAMIRDWRAQFGLDDVPFLIVQLPRYLAVQTAPSEGGWAGLREAELLASQDVARVGLAVTIDTGQADDIHPKDKQDVGERLAVLARGLAYGEAIAHQGPTYRGMQVEGASIRITFASVPTGLMVGSKQPLAPVTENPSGTLVAFAIAGADQSFVWATATIDGSTVVVSAPGVPSPAAVRYGWATNPACNLYGKEGLPASPFRTDAW